MGTGTDLKQRWPGQERFECAVCGLRFWRYPHRNRGTFVACSYSCANVVKNWQRARRAYATVRVMSEPERAWLAAAIDGEGCVGYARGYPRITIVNTDLNFLERARDFVGAGQIRGRRREKSHHRSQWYWAIDGYGAISVLEQTVDWMVIKQDKGAAALATRFDSLVRLREFEQRQGGENVALRDCHSRHK